MTMGGATFTEQGDGSVVITYPDAIPLNVEVSRGEELSDETVSDQP